MKHTILPCVKDITVVVQVTATRPNGKREVVLCETLTNVDPETYEAAYSDVELRLIALAREEE